MDRKLLCLVLAFFGLVLIPGFTFAATPFYEGKVIRFLVGGAAGGGFDTYARILARHMGKHIPGNPKMIIENTEGAGGMLAANRLYKNTKPDGLTIGHFNGSCLFAQIVGKVKGAEFDAHKFEYIGSLARIAPVFILSKASGITNMDQWMNSKTPVKLGGSGISSLAHHDSPLILNVAIGLPVRLILGYKGTAEIKLAVGSHEVDGSCMGWESAKVTWRKDLETGNAFVILQALPEPLPDFPKVPLAINFAKTDDARKLIEAGIHSQSFSARPFILPPGTPKERVQALRKALQEILKDKEFLAEAEKVQLDLDPVTGEKLESAFTGLAKLDPVMSAKLKEILFKQ